MKNQTNTKKATTLADTELALHLTMVEEGIAFPKAPEDIESFEALIDDDCAPTPDINKFIALLAGREYQAQDKLTNAILFPMPEFNSQLAAAARNGGVIDPEIRKRMNDHRAAAEKRAP